MARHTPAEPFTVTLDTDPTRAALISMAPGALAWLGQFYTQPGFDRRSYKTSINLSFDYDNELTSDPDSAKGLPFRLWTVVLDQIEQLVAVGARLRSGGYMLSDREAPTFSPTFYVGVVDDGYGSLSAVANVTLRAELDMGDLLRASNDLAAEVARDLCNWAYRSLVEENGADRADPIWDAILARAEQHNPL